MIHHSDKKKQLKRLLAERNQSPSRVADIDVEIKRVFERKVSMLILDMCGFSRLTATHGIIHYLALIEQMDNAARPAVLQNQGIVLKQEADNLFAIFNHPTQALEAAIDIFGAFNAINTVMPDERDIHGCVGIGFGDSLVIGEEDLFGYEMNLASKLGEDLAGKMEILLTRAAFDALPAGQFKLAARTFETSGMDIEAYLYEGRGDEDLT